MKEQQQTTSAFLHEAGDALKNSDPAILEAYANAEQRMAENLDLRSLEELELELESELLTHFEGDDYVLPDYVPPARRV